MLFRLVLGKERLNILVSSLELFLVKKKINLLNTRGENKTVFTFILDRGWRESRLPSLARVLLCLVRIGVPQVSCAVRYLDKPQWRAVKDNKDRHSKVGRNFSLNII